MSRLAAMTLPDGTTYRPRKPPAASVLDDEDGPSVMVTRTTDEQLARQMATTEWTLYGDPVAPEEWDAVYGRFKLLPWCTCYGGHAGDWQENRTGSPGYHLSLPRRS